MVDHTLLKPEATADDVAALAREAEELGAYSICVSPNMLPVETSVKVATVCGFPSGKHTSTVKAAEAAESVERGADEVDMVIDLGLAKAGDFDGVEADIRAVVEAAGLVLVDGAQAGQGPGDGLGELRGGRGVVGDLVVLLRKAPEVVDEGCTGRRGDGDGGVLPVRRHHEDLLRLGERA